MIGEQRQHVGMFAQHILHKSLQRLLRPNLHKHARAGIVKRAQSLDKLHRRRHLPRQNIQHLGHGLRPGGIELAIDIGDHRNMRRFQMQPLERTPQRLAGRRHNRRMKRMAHRQRDGVVAGFLEQLHGLLHGFARAADHRLGIAVQIGDHHVAIHRAEDALDLRQRRKHRRHAAVIGHRDARHFAAACAHGFQGIRERHGARAH